MIMGRKLQKSHRKYLLTAPGESVPPIIVKTSKLVVEKCISLSDREYSVFRMTLSEERIGYFGVYPSGKYQYSLSVDCINEIDIIHFIEDYICDNLGLTPINISK